MRSINGRPSAHPPIRYHTNRPLYPTPGGSPVPHCSPRLYNPSAPPPLSCFFRSPRGRVQWVISYGGNVDPRKASAPFCCCRDAHVPHCGCSPLVAPLLCFFSPYIMSPPASPASGWLPSPTPRAYGHHPKNTNPDTNHERLLWLLRGGLLLASVIPVPADVTHALCL